MKAKERRAEKYKHRLWNIYRRSGAIDDYQRYVTHRNITAAMVKQAQYNYEQDLVKKFKSSPKLFYKHVRGNQNVRSGVTKLIPNPGDNPTETDYEAAEMLCTFFESVFVAEGNEDLPDFPDRVTEEMSLREPTFTKDDVRKKLQKLKPDKSQEPDGIHPKVQECASQLSYPLFTIFRRSLEEGRSQRTGSLQW